MAPSNTMLSNKSTVEHKGLEEKRSWNVLLPERMGQASWTTAVTFFSLTVLSFVPTLVLPWFEEIPQVRGGQPKPLSDPNVSGVRFHPELAAL